MQNKLLLIASFAMIFVLIFLQNSKEKIPVLNYFPIDEEASFDIAHTNLTINKEKNIVNWNSQSISNSPFYLRQDISLLYENGYFKGIQSKWVEDTDTIELTQSIKYNANHSYEAISYHHGEIHHNDSAINGIQEMSAARLNQSTKITDQQIIDQLNDLFDYYDIDYHSYVLLPLTQLAKYNNENISSFSKQETDKIIGQLWEGLYKNYVIPLLENKKNSQKDFMPVILLDKQMSHLIVLFKLNGQNEMLIQQFSN